MGIHREITLSTLVRITREAMVMVGGILLILAVSLAFTNFLVDSEVPQWLFEQIQQVVSSPLTFLLLLNIILLLLFNKIRLVVCNSPGAFGDYFPGEYADWLLHAAGRDELVHRQLPV